MPAEKLTLFTHADPLQQEQLNLHYPDLERSLKNSVLLFGKVTLPGSCILKSDLTYKLLSNAKELLQHGLIVPDLRDEYSSYGNYVEKNRHALKGFHGVKEKAVFLDKFSPPPIRFQAATTSSYLEDNLISSLFYLKLNGDVHVSWDVLRDFIKAVKKPGVSDRAFLLKQLHKITPHRIVRSTTQALYHTVGALVTNSHPIWPQVYSDSFVKIRAAQLNADDNIRYSREGRKLIDKYKFITPVEGAMPADIKKIRPDSHDGLVPFSFINNDTLDALTWQDVINISRSNAAIKAHKKIFKQSSAAEYIDLSEIFKQEKSISKRIRKVTLGIALTSFLVDAAGFFDDYPLIAQSGRIMSVAGILLTIGDLLMDQAEKRMNSYNMLGELIADTAIANRIAFDKNL